MLGNNSPFFSAIISGYLSGRVIESCIWRSHDSRICWLETSVLIPLLVFASHSLSIGEESSSSSSSFFFSFWLPYLLSWTGINALVDVVLWWLAQHQQQLPKTSPVTGGAIYSLDLKFLACLAVTTLFLSMIMLPGSLLFAVCNVCFPPQRPGLAGREALARVYPPSFVDRVFFIPVNGSHPIELLVNVVMGSGVSSGALAFALFNCVFTGTHGQKRHHLPRTETNARLITHECVHVAQQAASRSVLSFLAVYLAQYTRNLLRDGVDMESAYLTIAAEVQAYHLEDIARIAQSANASARAVSTDPTPIRERILKTVQRDFYFKWYCNLPHLEDLDPASDGDSISS